MFIKFVSTQQLVGSVQQKLKSNWCQVQVVPGVRDRKCVLTGVRTAGQVGGAVSISRVDVLRGRCGHLQVDHLPCVLQGRHSVFMQDILQGHMVHLRGGRSKVR